jgi:hypothetical protein
MLCYIGWPNSSQNNELVDPADLHALSCSHEQFLGVLVYNWWIPTLDVLNCSILYHLSQKRRVNGMDSGHHFELFVGKLAVHRPKGLFSQERIRHVAEKSHEAILDRRSNVNAGVPEMIVPCKWRGCAASSNIHETSDMPGDWSFQCSY